MARIAVMRDHAIYPLSFVGETCKTHTCHFHTACMSMRMWKSKDLTEGIPRAVSSDLRLLCLDIETGEKPAENRRANERARPAASWDCR